mgnify:CR=1 FL=1
MLLLTHFLEYLNNPRFLGVIIILAVISLGILVYNKIKHSWVVSLIKKVVLNPRRLNPQTKTLWKLMV